MVMASMIICGSGSMPREEDDDEFNRHHQRATQSAGSSPRRSSSSFSRRIKSHNHHKNPYATRGLDKFCALLADIEEKKEKIYSEINPDEICFVQFDYSKNNHCKPIVIKVKQSNKEQIKKIVNSEIEQNRDPLVSMVSTSAITEQHRKSEALDCPQANCKKRLLRRLRKPSFYLPAVLIMILIFLALFGRSVTILCTSIVWYAIPTISRPNLNSRSSFKNKGLVAHRERA